MASDRGENRLGALLATVSSLPAERIASGLPTLQVCIVASELSGLVKTINSVERAVEVAISREAIFSASLEIASLRGDWSRENDGGILSKSRSHIYSVRAHDVGEQESKAGAYNILMSSATMDIVVMVQGGSLLATNALVYLAEALRHAPTALAGARRLPVEIVAPYDPSTGRTGYMDPFCGAIWGLNSAISEALMPSISPIIYLQSICHGARERPASRACGSRRPCSSSMTAPNRAM